MINYSIFFFHDNDDDPYLLIIAICHVIYGLMLKLIYVFNADTNRIMDRLEI